MRIENENEYYISKKAIINSEFDFNNFIINETIQFTFIDQLCNGILDEKELKMAADTLIVNDSITSNINIIPQQETLISSIYFHKKHFIQTVSKYLDNFQHELAELNIAVEKTLNTDFHLFKNKSKLQAILSDILKTKTSSDSRICDKLAQLKMETFIIEALQTDLINVFKSLIGNNYSTDPISYTLKLIADTPQKNWSIKALAKKANVSESTLYRYFKKELKITPNQYLWDIKLNHAKKLLRENLELNISQIGYNVGIQNPFYFSKIFKQHIGVSPKQYRESTLEKVV